MTAGFPARIFLGLLVIALWITIGVEFTLIHGNGKIHIAFIRYIYIALFFLAPLIVLLNAVEPIFYKRAISAILRPLPIVLIAVVDVLVFTALLVYGFIEVDRFKKIYLEKILILQIVNLIYLWTIVCGLVGQERFPPFWREVMRRPASTLGYCVTNSLLKARHKIRKKD